MRAFSAVAELLVIVLCKISPHPNWPVYSDVFEHPAPRLASQCPVWYDMTPVDVSEQWRKDWASANVVNNVLYFKPYPTARFRYTSPFLAYNCFRTGQRHYLVNLTSGVWPQQTSAAAVCDRS